MKFFHKAVITGLGTGYLPAAPGTWGSAAVCGIYLLAAWLSGGDAAWMSAVVVIVALVASVGCVVWGRRGESYFGKKDPRKCTVDEWAGQALALLALPAGGDFTDRLVCASVAFGAFRLFDIVKPPPVRQMERLKGGWGILADDIIAGLYANVAAQLILRAALKMQ